MTTTVSHERRTWLGRMGAWCYDHRRRVLAGLVAVIALAIPPVRAGAPAVSGPAA